MERERRVIRKLISVVVNVVMLASGLLGMLFRGRRASLPSGYGDIPARWRPPAKLASGPATADRPIHGVHYRFSEDTRGGRCQRIEALCPDGVWRAFLWTTNAENPWLADYGRRFSYRKSAPEMARWLSDKFIGPEHLPRDVGGGGEAMSEEGVRSSSCVGVWVLDPYDAGAHRRAGYPFHGEGWPNSSVRPLPSGERLEDIRLLPCYESCRGRIGRRGFGPVTAAPASGGHSIRRCRVCAVLCAFLFAAVLANVAVLAAKASAAKARAAVEIRLSEIDAISVNQ